MKKDALERHLRRQGCRLLRQGAKHEWWVNGQTEERSAVPRHSEIQNVLAKKICRDLGVGEPMGRR